MMSRQRLANLDAPAPIGIGGSHTMTAGGEEIIKLEVSPTGIDVPAGIPVKIIVSGGITRTQTAGLKEFCELPRWAASCKGAWVPIIEESAIPPSGIAALGGEGRAIVSWGGATASPSAGSSVALRGSSGGVVSAGRDGWGCSYFDSEHRLEGPCLTFGGAFVVTVQADDGSDDAGGGGGGGGDDEPTLSAEVLSAFPSGGRTHAVVVATAKDNATIDNARWTFVPDSTSTVDGEAPPPEPSSLRASYAAAVVATVEDRDAPVVLGDSLLLPDGRVVGSGVHLYRIPGGDRPARKRSRIASGDTSSVQRLAGMPMALAAANQLASCDGMTTCGAEVEGTKGTFVVVATVNGKELSATDRVDGTRTSELVLTCPASVQRGSSATCIASASDSSATVVPTGWSLMTTTGDKIQRAEHVEELKWSGVMAQSGVVTLEATVNGVPKTKTASIALTPRNWSVLVLETNIHDDGPDHLPARPTSPHDLGDIHHGLEVTDALIMGRMKIIDDGGPNEGVTYLTGVPFRYSAAVHVNTTALKSGSEFWRNHPVRRPDVGTTCSQLDVVNAPRLVREHEGTDRQVNSHAWFYTEKIKELWATDPAPADLEGVVGYLGLDLTDVNNRVVNFAVRAHAEAVRASDRADARGTNNFTPGCNFIYF